MYFSHLVIYLLCVLWNIYRCSFEEFTRAKKIQDGKCFIEEGCIIAEFHSEDTCTDNFIPDTISYIVFNFIGTKCLQGHVPSEVIWFWIYPSWQLITECWNIKKCELNISLQSGRVLIGILVHLQSTKTPWLFLMDLSEDNLTRNGMRMFVCQGKMWHIRSLKSRVPENVFDKLLFQTKKYLLEFKHFTQNQRSKRSIRNQSLGLFDEVLFLPTSSEYRYSRDIFDDNNDYFPQHVYGVFDDNLSSHLNKLVASDDFLNDLSPEISLESTYKDSSKQRLHQNRGSKEKKTDFMVEKAFPFAFVDSLQSDVERSLQKSLDVLDLHGIDNDIANPTDKDDLEELIPINQHRKHTEIALTANKHRNSLKDEPMTFQKEFEKTNKHQNTALDDMLNFLSNLETDKFSENKDKFSLNILPTPVRPIDVLEDHEDNADMFNLLSNLETDKFSKNKDKFSLNILPTPVRPIDVLEDQQDNADIINLLSNLETDKFSKNKDKFSLNILPTPVRPIDVLEDQQDNADIINLLSNLDTDKFSENKDKFSLNILPTPVRPIDVLEDQQDNADIINLLSNLDTDKFSENKDKFSLNILPTPVRPIDVLEDQQDNADIINLLSNLDTDKFSKNKDKFSLNILQTPVRPIDVLEDHPDNADMFNLLSNLKTEKFSKNKDKFSLNTLPTPVRPIDVLEDNQDNADVISNIRTVMLLPKDIVNSELAQNWNMTKELNASVQDINVKNHKLETEEESLFTSVMWLKERIEELLHENSPINQEDLLKQMKTIIHEATYSAVKAMVKDISQACEEPLRDANAWKEWGRWSTCSSSCGSFGFRLRHRSCEKDFICTGLSFDIKSCKSRTPCEGPQWLVWSSWQECSATCGTSIQYRTRACLTEDHSKTCEGKFLDLRECSVNPCPHETTLEQKPVTEVIEHLQESSFESDHWTSWDEWSTCSATCKQGMQFRERICMHLREEAEEENTFSCPGSSKEMRVCDTGPCSLPVAIQANLLNVVEGSTASLACNYTGDLPVQDIYWITPHGQRIGKFSSSERYLVHNNELIISNVQSFDEGTYLCILVGADGQMAESASNMRVETCENEPCQNGALCEEVVDVRFVDGFHFRCLCQPGYHGRYCQHRSVVTADLPWLKALGVLLIFLMLTLIFVSICMCMYYREQDKRERSLSYFQPYPHSRRKDSHWAHMKSYSTSSKGRTDSTNPSIGDFSMLESLKVRTGSDDKSQKTLKYDDSACQSRDNSVYAIRDNSVCASRASSDISKDTNVCNDSLTSDSLCYLNHESYLVDPVELHTSSLEIESIATIPHHSFTDSPPIELEPARTNGNSEVIYQDNIMKIVSHPTTTRLDELASDINSFTKEDLTGSPTVRFLDKNDFLQEKDGYLLPRHSTPNEDLEQFDYVNSFPKSWFAYDQRPSVGTSSARQAYSSRDASHSAKAKLTTHGYSTGLANTRDKDQAVYYFMEGNREFNQSCTNAESIDWNNHGLSSEDSDDGSSASSSSEGHVMGPQNLDCAVGNLDNLVTNGEKNRKEDKQDRFTDEACGHDAEQSSSSGSNAKNMRPGVKSSAEVCAVTSPATRHESTLSRYPIGAGRSSRGGPQPPHISAASIIFGKDDLNERFPQNQLSHNEAANSARQSVPCQGGDRLPRVDASQQKHLEGGGEGSSTSVRCNQHKSARDVLLRRALENSFVQSTTESCAMTFSQCPPRAGQTPVVSDGQPVRNSQLASLNRSKKCEPRASYKKHQSVEWKKQRIRLPDIGIQDNSLSVHENSFVSEQFPGLPKCIHGRPRVATEREGRRGNNIQASTTATEKWLFSEAAESCCSESSQTFIHKDLTFSPIVPDSAASSSDPSNFVISSWSANTDKHCASIDQKSSQKEPSAARSKQSISTSQEENNVRNEMVEETCSDSSISLSDSMYSKGSINQNNLLSSPLRSMLKGSRYASHKGSVTDMSTLERRVSFKEPEVIKVEHSGSDFNISGYRPVSPLPTVQQLDSRSCQSEGSPTADHQFGGSGQRHVLQSSPPCKNISTKQNSNSPQNTSAHLSHSSVENSYGSSQRSEVSASTLSFSYFPAIYAHRAHHRLNKCEIKPAQEQQLDVNASPSRRDSQHFPKLSQISNRHFLGKPVCGHEHQQITDESRHRCNGWGRSRKPATAKKASEHLNVCAYNSQSHLSDATAPAKISGTNLQNPAHPGDICWPTGQSPSLPSMGAKVAAQLHGTRSAHLCNPRKVPEPRNPSTHKWKRHQPRSQTCHLVSGSGPLQYIQEPLKLNTATALVAATMSDKACLSDEVVARSTAPGTLEKSTLTEKLNPCGNSTSDASGVQQIQEQSPIKFASLRKSIGTHAKQHTDVMDSSTSKSTKSQPLTRQAQEDPDGLDLTRQIETNATPSGRMSPESFHQLLSHRTPNAFFKPIEKQDKHDEQHTG